MTDGLDVAILGALRVSLDGRTVPLAGPRQRSVIASLALRPNRIVSAGTLVAEVWGEDAPEGAGHSLQQQISSLRKLLGRSDVLVTSDPGYVLVVRELDADRFERAARAGADAVAAGRPHDGLTQLDDALECWTGPVLADVDPSDAILAASTRLDELRVVAQEDRVDALLALGREREAVTALEPLVTEHPYRERLRAQQMLALYRSGRQSDALAAYGEARTALVEGLGIEPSPRLRELEQMVLEQSDRLELGAARQPDVALATYRAEAGPAALLELPDGQSVMLTEGTVLVGRDPSAPVRLVDSRVSRRHAEIVTLGGESAVVDAGSTNGTFVNGDAVTRATLRDGDVVSIGGVELTYRSATR